MSRLWQIEVVCVVPTPLAVSFRLARKKALLSAMRVQTRFWFLPFSPRHWPILPLPPLSPRRWALPRWTRHVCDMQEVVASLTEETAMQMYGLQHLEVLRDEATATKCLVAWGPHNLVISFRGTANMKNAVHDAKVCPQSPSSPRKACPGGVISACKECPRQCCPTAAEHINARWVTAFLAGQLARPCTKPGLAGAPQKWLQGLHFKFGIMPADLSPLFSIPNPDIPSSSPPHVHCSHQIYALSGPCAGQPGANVFQLKLSTIPGPEPVCAPLLGRDTYFCKRD